MANQRNSRKLDELSQSEVRRNLLRIPVEDSGTVILSTRILV